MEYILRRTTLNTIEMRAEIDEEGKTPDQIRDELNMLGYLHGWKESVTDHQTVLTEINGEGGCNHIVGQWSEL